MFVAGGYNTGYRWDTHDMLDTSARSHCGRVNCARTITNMEKGGMDGSLMKILSILKFTSKLAENKYQNKGI